MTALLELHADSLGYGESQPVLGKLCLKISKGERIAVIGMSGCGKSTLLRHLFLSRQTTTGQPNTLSAALIPQNFDLVENLSVFHNVYMSRLDRHSTLANLRNLLLPNKRQVAAIEPILRNLGLEDKLFAPAGSLSGGQKQRTAVARAIFQRADLLLADEPVSSVDAQQAIQILEILVHHYPTSVVALHNIELALRFATRIIGIRDSSLAIDRPASELGPDDLSFLYS